MYSAGMMRFKLETDWNAVNFAAQAQVRKGGADVCKIAN